MGYTSGTGWSDLQCATLHLSPDQRNGRLPSRPMLPIPNVTDPVSTQPAEVLHEVFGYTAFRGHQQAIVEHVVAGGDALVLMTTGGGKSL